MKALYERLYDATIRMEQMLLLAGMLNDGDSLPNPLRDLLEDDPETLQKAFPDMPAELAEVDDSDEFKEGFLEWVHHSGKLGFVVQFARPVMDWSADKTSASFSWGYYSTAWFYGETLEQVVERGVVWATEREAAEKAKPKKVRASQAA